MNTMAKKAELKLLPDFRRPLVDAAPVNVA